MQPYFYSPKIPDRLPADKTQFLPDGVAHFKLLCQGRGLSQVVSEALLRSINPASLKSYCRHWTPFVTWLNSKKPRPHFSSVIICEYLLSKFNKNLSISTINSIRSAIGFFTLNALDLENDILSKRLFKHFYQIRPSQPKYSTFWPVSKVLDLLKAWHPPSSLTLRQLTLKTVSLMALSSSDRGQTLNLVSLDNLVVDSDLKFVIKERIKTTRRVLRPTIVNCVTTDIEELNVKDYVLFYIEATKDFRPQSERKLFTSWKSYKNVTRPTLARWLKTVLQLAGIDPHYGSHSYRGAGLSNAYFKGASIDQIIKAGNWSSVSTFKSFYCAPSSESSIGRIILNDV